MSKETENNVYIQKYGFNFPPMMNKKEAAEFLRIPPQTLTAMEEKGLILSEYVPPFTKPRYFKKTLENIFEIHKQWKKENPDAYAQIQR